MESGCSFQEGTDSDQDKNDGKAIWDKLVSKHENIFLVISGHQSADTVVMRQVKGEAGNTVTEMLIDPQTMDGQYQGGTGMVAMLYFSMDHDTVGVEYYSTNLGVYRPLQSFDIHHTHDHKDTVVPPTCDHHGYTAHVCACGDALDNTDLVPKLPHTYDDEYDAYCNVCDGERDVEERTTESETQTSEELPSTETPAESESASDSAPAESAPESTPESESTADPSAPTEEEQEGASEAPTAQATTDAPADGGEDGADAEFPLGATVALCALGGCALLGGGGFALYTLVLKKKK